MDWLGGLGALLLAAGAMLIAGLVPDEIRDWADRWAVMLARRYARRLPSHLRARAEEEWLAELSYIPGKISKLVFAWQLQIAAFELCRQSCVPHVRPTVLLAVRVFDFAFAATGLLLFLPFLLIAALVIRVGKRQPALLHVPVVGVNGGTFNVYFLNTKSDARGWVDRIINAAGLTWVPALWNVIRGDMTVVGTCAFPDLRVLYPDGPAPLHEEIIVRIRPGLISYELLMSTPSKAICSGDDEFVRNYSLKLIALALALSLGNKIVKKWWMMRHLMHIFCGTGAICCDRHCRCTRDE